MYYVDQKQIEDRLSVCTVLITACEEVRKMDSRQSLVVRFAVERTLQLAIEVVTDVGSLMIDGFLMRDASSYEDIIEILGAEGVFSKALTDQLMSMVQLRKSLIQTYYDLKSENLDSMFEQLPAMLQEFESSIRQYLHDELL